MYKKIICPALCLLISVSLISCSSIETVELNERLIIESIGIDGENGIYKVTIEGLDSFTAGNDSTSISGEALTKCFLFEGDTIGMAMNSISVITGQIPLFSQARVLIIGRETAENKLAEVLDFFRREYTTRTDILIAVAENKASDIISADYGKNVSAGNILEAALYSYEHTGTSAYVPLYQFFNSAMNETDSAYCPLVGVKTNRYSEKSEVSIYGTIALGKEKSIVLTPEMTQAMMLINNDIKNGDLSLEAQKGLCTIEIISSRTKTKVSIDDKNVIFDIHTELRCDIPEYQSPDFSGLTREDTETIAGMTAKKIAVNMLNTLEAVYFGENYDIFSFGRRINLKNSGFYESTLKKDGSFVQRTICNISVTVSVRRIGKVVLKK